MFKPTLTVAIFTLLTIAAGYITKPTQADIDACIQSTQWSKEKCQLELTR